MTESSNKMVERQRMEDFIAALEKNNPALFECVYKEAEKKLKNTDYMMAFITPIKDKKKREKRLNNWARWFFIPDLMRDQYGDRIESGAYTYKMKQAEEEKARKRQLEKINDKKDVKTIGKKR